MRAGLRRALLKTLWVLNLSAWHPGADELARLLGLSREGLDSLLSSLGGEGLVERLQDGGARLTPSGRRELTVVLTAGTFDILHGGHVLALERAKERGDVLVVVLARDANVRRIKGRDPILDERERVTLVSALKPVDLALLGDADDPVKPLEGIRPDVVVLGFNQPQDEGELASALLSRGLSPRIVRLAEFKEEPGSTSAILREVVRRYLQGELAPVLEGEGEGWDGSLPPPRGTGAGGSHVRRHGRQGRP